MEGAGWEEPLEFLEDGGQAVRDQDADLCVAGSLSSLFIVDLITDAAKKKAIAYRLDALVFHGFGGKSRIDTHEAARLYTVEIRHLSRGPCR